MWQLVNLNSFWGKLGRGLTRNRSEYSMIVFGSVCSLVILDLFIVLKYHFVWYKTKIEHCNTYIFGFQVISCWVE